MQVGDLVRHNKYGKVGILVSRVKGRRNMRRVLVHGIHKLWLIEYIEVINESR